jgi:undecaprenyl-diphosphatase
VALTQLIVLAVLQTITEVFPIGADGHLALIAQILRWPAPDPGFLLALRLGLLLAVVAYFWRDLADMIVGVIRAAKGKRDPGARLALQLGVAGVATVAAGSAFEHYVAGPWETPVVMGWAIVGGALLLLLFDRMSMTVKRIEHASFADAIVIGLCQVIGLIPGVGTAAITITMARLLGYERADAARFFFLLSIPVSAVLTVREAYRLFDLQHGVLSRLDMLCAAVNFFAGLIAIAILMAWLRRSTFTPFVIYRVLLGGAVLALAYKWVSA